MTIRKEYYVIFFSNPILEAQVSQKLLDKENPILTISPDLPSGPPEITVHIYLPMITSSLLMEN